MTASVPLYVFLSRHAFTKSVFGVIVTLKNETHCQDLMVLFCIHNSINIVKTSLGKMQPQTMIFTHMGLDTNLELVACPWIFVFGIQPGAARGRTTNFQFSRRPALRPPSLHKTYCHWFSVRSSVVWHTSSFSFWFSSLIMSSWQLPFCWDHLWCDFFKQ